MVVAHKPARAKGRGTTKATKSTTMTTMVGRALGLAMVLYFSLSWDIPVYDYDRYQPDPARPLLQQQTQAHQTPHQTPNKKCCHSTSVDFAQKFTAEYFDEQAAKFPTKWTGRELQEWKNFTTHDSFGRALLDPSTIASTRNNQIDACRVHWSRLVLASQDGYYLPQYLERLRGPERGSVDFRYINDRPHQPRILILGDSISQGVWMWTQSYFGNFSNLQGAPTNCHGFEHYDEYLHEWLGDCEWDLIQFQVGHHFHATAETAWQPYLDGFARAAATMREHSPNAHLVFALTTPSPFDSPDTTPKDDGSCPHYHLFHPEGFVSNLNAFAYQAAQAANVSVIDRYGAILPHVGKYQRPCDIHYSIEGYQILARTDWAHYQMLLGL